MQQRETLAVQITSFVYPDLRQLKWETNMLTCFKRYRLAHQTLWVFFSFAQNHILSWINPWDETDGVRKSDVATVCILGHMAGCLSCDGVHNASPSALPQWFPFCTHYLIVWCLMLKSELSLHFPLPVAAVEITHSRETSISLTPGLLIAFI